MINMLKNTFLSNKNKKKLFIVFIIIMSARFLFSIFNLSLVTDVYNTVFNYAFIIFIIYISLVFRNEKEDRNAKIVKYVMPCIIIIASLIFQNIFSMITPYFYYFFLSVIILPLFQTQMGWKNVMRFLLIGVLIIVVEFIGFLVLIFHDFGAVYTRDEFVFPNNANKKLVIVVYDQGALGGNTIVVYEEKIAGNVLKCEKQLAYGRWSTEYNLEGIYKDITKNKIQFCGINLKEKESYKIN